MSPLLLGGKTSSRTDKGRKWASTRAWGTPSRVGGFHFGFLSLSTSRARTPSLKSGLLMQPWEMRNSISRQAFRSRVRPLCSCDRVTLRLVGEHWERDFRVLTAQALSSSFPAAPSVCKLVIIFSTEALLWKHAPTRALPATRSLPNTLVVVSMPWHATRPCCSPC